MPPESTIIVPNKTPPATSTNSPTSVRSRIASIFLPDPFRKDSQVIYLAVFGRIGDAVQKLADPGVLAVLHFFRRPHSHDVPAVDQDDPVGDRKRARQL